MQTVNFEEMEIDADKQAGNCSGDKYPYLVGRMTQQFKFLKGELADISEKRDSLNKHQLMDSLDEIISKLEFEAETP